MSAILAHIQHYLVAHQQTLAVAESMTGGLLGAQFTSQPGSSGFFSGGIIAYHPALKIRLLQVKPATIAAYSPVSQQCAEEMAFGCRSQCSSDWAISITGLAGPSGDPDFPSLPIGTVYIGIAGPQNFLSVESCQFANSNRGVMRAQAVEHALAVFWKILAPTMKEQAP